MTPRVTEAGFIMALTQRQKTILRLATEQYIRSGIPVSSKAVAAGAGFKVSPSTVRNEFAVLEEQGYLTHPHTSAGRIPTDSGYRQTVDSMMACQTGRETAAAPVQLEELATEVDAAMRQTSDAMARATNLLALVVAPRVSGARLRHVELLLLQPSILLVVFIVSTGRVTKEMIEYPAPLDPGMVEWARSYLNELLGDSLISERTVRRVLGNPELSPKETSFLNTLGVAFNRLLDEESSSELYVGGASALVDRTRVHDLQELHHLMLLLEDRYMILRILRSALTRDRVFLSIGEENEAEPLRRFSLVAAGYGPPQRTLGAVSLVGPTRMDYHTAIATVRGTAHLLSQFLEDRYE